MMTNHEDSTTARADAGGAAVLALRAHTNRVLAGVIGAVPSVSVAVLVERGTEDVIATRARDDSHDVQRAPSPGVDAGAALEVQNMIDWARAYARASTTVRCEAVNVRRDTMWAAQARGSSGRYVLAVIADRTAVPSEVLQHAHVALVAIERFTV